VAIHLLGLAALTGGIVLCTLLPFLPGRYDPLATPLSALSIAFGMMGLLVVPFAGLWLASAHGGRLAGRRRGFAIATLIAMSVVWLILAFVGLMSAGIPLAAIILAGGACLVRRVGVWRHGRTLPLYLLVVPVAVAILQVALVGAAVERSRSRAIRNSAPLIADIERFRAANGRYPVSLHALWPDYLPGVAGIERYHYEPSGEAYNVFFEQLSSRLGTREIVVYNPRDEQMMMSHAMDRLRPRGGGGGYYAVHDAPQPHWKYFWFD
jgi:hypothetical protein